MLSVLLQGQQLCVLIAALSSMPGDRQAVIRQGSDVMQAPFTPAERER